MKIREIISLLLLCCVILPISSCKDDIVKVKQNQIELTFAFWEPGLYKDLETALDNVAVEYEKEHPNVRIKFIAEPVDDYNDWIKMRIASDNMPDIESNAWDQLEKQYYAGLIADISNSLKKESPYEQGKMWKDVFIPERLKLPNQNVECSIPLFGVELAMFYNKKIYNELGLEIPTTWSDFINNCEVIKNANKIPIVMMGQKQSAVNWLSWEIGTSLVIKKHLGDKDININGDRIISSYEKSRAVALGLWDISRDTQLQDEYKLYLSHLSEYLSYCKDSFDYEESVAKMEFLNGNAGHMNTGSWDLNGFINQQNDSFEVGTFKFPEFTEEDTDYPGGRIMTYGVQSVAITKSVYKQEGKFEAAVDFLQYLTSKDVYQQFIDSIGEIPVVEDVVLDEKLKGFISEGFINTVSIFTGTENWAYDILSGITPTLDQNYFDKVHEKEKLYANQVLNLLNLSSDNKYYYSEKIYGGLYRYPDSVK